MSSTLREKFAKFCRLRLGLKPIVDYAQSRAGLIGVGSLPIRTVFDIGANVGRKSRHYRKLFPDATIYCFEPVPASYERLARWARRQNGKVKTFQLALGNESDNATIYWNVVNSGGSSLIASRHRHPEEREIVELPVRIERLDSVAAKLTLEDDILVKIDVEDFDMEVIRGGTNVMKRASAVILEIRLFESPTDQPDFADFVATMSQLGYMYRGNLSQAYVQGVPRLVDAVFIRPRQAQRAAA